MARKSYILCECAKEHNSAIATCLHVLLHLLEEGFLMLSAVSRHNLLLLTSVKWMSVNLCCPVSQGCVVSEPWCGEREKYEGFCPSYGAASIA